MPDHPHIVVPPGPDPIRFTSPSSGPRDRMDLPPRSRATHAAELLARLETASAGAADRAQEQTAFGIDEGLGLYLTFESAPNFELKFESLDVERSGIELCTVKTSADNRTEATVFVPDGKLELFITKVAAYRDENTTPRSEGAIIRPKNQGLVESISDVRIAALEALWTEPDVPFPANGNVLTWEVWLRRDRGIDQLRRLKDNAERLGLSVGQQSVSFIDRKVVLVRGTAANLSRSTEILGMIAELRLPKATAGFFTAMNPRDQQNWVNDLVGRVTTAPDTAPYVCILDTGVNRGHPLLAGSIAAADVHTYKPGWGTNDQEGHGTPMAGLAALGDLTDALATGHPIVLGHRLESVKIVHPTDEHDPDLYGAVTQESAYRVEVTADRTRVFCLAITASDNRDRGRPSSWSAAIDSLAAGYEDEEQRRRLIIVAAGNTDPAGRADYPNSNMADGVHDPAQAWNALTIGGYTQKDIVDAARFPGWEPLAPSGDLAPASCTSTTWRKWPIKPDIVMEAGNMARNAAFAEPDYIDDGLQLLSTGSNFLLNRPFTSFGDTSAAAALAARYAAMLLAKYPDLSPEAVRALIVHAAEWTPQMLHRFTRADGSIDYTNLVRCCGRGVPDLHRLLSSADNSLTLIAESEIQPFFKDADDRRVKTREMRLHPLPWPTDILNELEDAQVTMKVTLSYFVEPSPGARGWTSKYGYQSHGLRFAVRNPLESKAAFEQRVNKASRDEDYDAPGLSDRGWQFGHGLRSLTSIGSIHTDVWRGTAAELAARGFIGVYPTMGWWNKRPQFEGWAKSAHYSLIATIAAPEVEIDLYTPVAMQVGIPVVIET